MGIFKIYRRMYCLYTMTHVFKSRKLFNGIVPLSWEQKFNEFLIATGSKTFFTCFDIAAGDLHLAYLPTIVALLHCQRASHDVILVVNGVNDDTVTNSSFLGDQKGDITASTNTQTSTLYNAMETLVKIFGNHAVMCKSDQTFDHEKLGKFHVYNNLSWHSQLNVVDFVSLVGSQLRLHELIPSCVINTEIPVQSDTKEVLQHDEAQLHRNVIKPLLQSYDWLHIHKDREAVVRIEFSKETDTLSLCQKVVSRVLGKPCFGITLQNISAQLSSRSQVYLSDYNSYYSKDMLWLNAAKTSPFELYQKLLNIPDCDVETWLWSCTLLTSDEIQHVMKIHENNCALRIAQIKLAEQIVTLLHTPRGLAIAQLATQIFFHDAARPLQELSTIELDELIGPGKTLGPFVLHANTTVLGMIKMCGIDKLVGKNALDLISTHTVFVNQMPCTQPDQVLVHGQHVLSNNRSLLRIGKKRYWLIKWSTV